MTLLQRTDQLWKIYLFAVLFGLGCAAALLQGFFYAPLGKELAMQIGLGGVGLVVGSFVWAGQNVTCPKCRVKLLYHAFRHHGFFRWLSWLVEQDVCPKCGYGEMPRSSVPRKKVKGLRRP